MEIRVINEISQLRAMATEWKRLAQECGDLDNPYICYDWVTKWWDCYGAGRQLHILSLVKDQRLVALGPFMIQRGGMFRTLHFIGFPQANYMDLLIAGEEIREECVRRILEHLKDNRSWHLVDLHGFKASSLNYPLLCAGLLRRKSAFFAMVVPAFFIPLHGKTFDEQMKDCCARHNKAFQTSRRSRKKLGQLGTIHYETLPPEKLSLIFELHNKRWAKKMDTSGFSDPDSRRFFTELAVSPAGDFKTGVTALYLNQRFLAYEYGFECNGRYLLYRLAHDDDYHYYSPGRLLVENKIQGSFAAGWDAFDFGIGYERYKVEWTDTSFQVQRLIFRGSGMRSWLGFGKAFLKEKSRALLKRYPKIVDFKRNTLGRIRFGMINAIRELTRRGLFNVLRCQAIKFMAWICHHDTFLIGAREIGSVSATASDGCFREATIDDLEALTRLTGLEPRDLIRRFYRNDKCLVRAEDGRIICGVWLSLTRLEISEWDYSVELPQTEAGLYHYFSATGPADYGDIIEYALSVLKGQPTILRLLACFRSDREQPFEAAGFKIRQHIQRDCKFGVKRVLISDLRKPSKTAGE